MNDEKLRQSSRIPITLPVVYKSQTLPESAVKCFDLSKGGICIPVEGGCSVGESISLSIAIPNKGSISCKGEVAWISKDRVGLRFSDVSEESREKLAEFLDSFEAEEKSDKIIKRIEVIETTLYNLKAPLKTVNESVDKLVRLLEDSSGKVTDEIQTISGKVAGDMAISRVIEKLREKLVSELSDARREFQRISSPETTENDLKKLAVCDYKLSPYFGSFCGIKFVVLSEGEEWDQEKCEQCIKFKRW